MNMYEKGKSFGFEYNKKSFPSLFVVCIFIARGQHRISAFLYLIKKKFFKSYFVPI